MTSKLTRFAQMETHDDIVEMQPDEEGYWTPYHEVMAEIERLRIGLAFYADPESWLERPSLGKSCAACDGGVYAMKALAGFPLIGGTDYEAKLHRIGNSTAEHQRLTGWRVESGKPPDLPSNPASGSAPAAIFVISEGESEQTVSILPCPFCGGEPLVADNWVVCRNCDAFGPFHEENYGQSQRIIEVWNNRRPAESRDLHKYDAAVFESDLRIARKIIAMLLRRERYARQSAKDAARNGYPELVLQSYLGAEIEAHNSAELALRMLEAPDGGKV